MHKDDLRRLAPEWLNWTKVVRADTEVRRPRQGGRPLPQRVPCVCCSCSCVVWCPGRAVGCCCPAAAPAQALGAHTHAVQAVRRTARAQRCASKPASSTLTAGHCLQCVQAYKDSGDAASKKGDRIWIAEMYGYAFGAARLGIWHHWAHDFMLYPAYTPSREQQQHRGLGTRCGSAFAVSSRPRVSGTAVLLLHASHAPAHAQQASTAARSAPQPLAHSARRRRLPADARTHAHVLRRAARDALWPHIQRRRLDV